jgi:primosomal replication protein N
VKADSRGAEPVARHNAGRECKEVNAKKAKASDQSIRSGAEAKVFGWLASRKLKRETG